MEKTQAMRVLEGRGVTYEARTYPASEREARRVASHLGVLPGHVFKTLVVFRPAGKHLLVMIPADTQLDLKLLAKAVGEKKLRMATHAEAERLTGMQVGGISPLALLNRGFVILADMRLGSCETVFVSAGRKGINLGLSAAALREITGARLVAVAVPAEPHTSP